MVNTARGLAIAFGLFAFSFALHIVGGRLDQDWLFALAVALIYLFATAFPVVAWLGAGYGSGDRPTLILGTVAGLGLTVSALWAASDRSFAWWQFPLAPVLVAVSSAAIYAAWQTLRRFRASPGPTADERA